MDLGEEDLLFCDNRFEFLFVLPQLILPTDQFGDMPLQFLLGGSEFLVHRKEVFVLIYQRLFVPEQFIVCLSQLFLCCGEFLVCCIEIVVLLLQFLFSLPAVGDIVEKDGDFPAFRSA